MATYADWQKRADQRHEETAPAAWYEALRILSGMSPGGSGNLFMRYLEFFGPEGTFDQLCHFLDKHASRYPHLAAKLAYSAALTMLGRAEYDVQYLMAVRYSPYQEMRRILHFHGIYTEIPQGYLHEQLSFALRIRSPDFLKLWHDRGSRPSRDVHVHSSFFNSGPMSASGNSMVCLGAVSGYTPPDRFDAFMTTINGKLDGLSAQMTASYGALEKKISEVNNALQQHKDDVDHRLEGIQTALMYTAEDFERRLRALEVGRDGGSGMTDRLPGPANAAGGPALSLSQRYVQGHSGSMIRGSSMSAMGVHRTPARFSPMSDSRSSVSRSTQPVSSSALPSWVPSSNQATSGRQVPRRDNDNDAKQDKSS